MTRGTDLAAAYRDALRERGHAPDPAQLRAIAVLEGVRLRLHEPAPRGGLRDWLAGRRGRTAATRGAYLWGGVGRGKTFLMDLFHAHAGVPTRRAHFHHFMRDVHARLRGLREREDPLRDVADGIAGDCRVQCLDELFVGDIADAMVLGGLFAALIERGVTLVCTSNQPPAELYRDGLQRQRFLPAIALLERHTELVHVDGGQDYRLRELERAPLYLDSGAADADAQLAERFAALAGHPGEQGGEIAVEGRRIATRCRAEDVAWFDFAALCAGPRGTADYVEIASEYHAVIVSAVPVLDEAQDNEARRFVALVDEFYDRGVKLVLSAAAPPERLYAGERLRFEFARTASRLVEMQSRAYLAQPHRP
jgi:cell division protein ZapE